MASYTPNLNLLMKDPVADGADTFNIETMLNQNWEKIDRQVLLAMAAYQVSILLAAMLLVAPAAAAVVFIRMFVANKPRGYFGFWLEERFPGSKLNPPQKAGGNHASA